MKPTAGRTSMKDDESWLAHNKLFVNRLEEKRTDNINDIKPFWVVPATSSIHCVYGTEAKERITVDHEMINP
jgi:hypothetical protein